MKNEQPHRGAAAGSPVSTATARSAYLRLLPEIAAQPLPARPISLDALLVVTTVIGAARRVQPLRQALIHEFRSFDARRFDELADYASAFHYAHLVHLSTITAPALAPELVQRAVAHRELLLCDARAAVKRGRMPASALRELKKVSGHRGLIMDLGYLELAFRESWRELETQCAVTQAELDEALTLASALTRGVASRDHGRSEASEAKRTRLRAFALLIAIYDKLRAQVGLLRHEQGDGDTYMESLYTTRFVKQKKARP